MHKGIQCAGPHCIDQSESLYGIPYKCTICHDVNLCSICIDGPFNDHERFYPMIRCLSPTQIYILRDIDEATRRDFKRSDSQDRLGLKDFSHIVYAVTDNEAVRSLFSDLSSHFDLNSFEATPLLCEAGLHIFAISRSARYHGRWSRVFKLVLRPENGPVDMSILVNIELSYLSRATEYINRMKSSGLSNRKILLIGSPASQNSK